MYHLEESLTALMKKKLGVIREGDSGSCDNPVRVSFCEGHIETAKYSWVNIPCMLDLIL